MRRAGSPYEAIVPAWEEDDMACEYCTSGDTFCPICSPSRTAICSPGRTEFVRRFNSTGYELGVRQNVAWFVMARTCARHKWDVEWQTHCGPYSTREQAVWWIRQIREVNAPAPGAVPTADSAVDPAGEIGTEGTTRDKEHS